MLSWLFVGRVSSLYRPSPYPALHPPTSPGDCYIVLNTYEKNGRRLYDAHFWLGDQSTIDERGQAALLTVHLDDSLGGAPVQHREVQGHESPLFMSYFKGGVRYLSGGIESSFRKVDRDAYDTRLFHVKGKREVRAMQVAVKSTSMNHGDVFVLDTGKKIFVWNGDKANKYEKLKGLDVARRIKDEERGGKAELISLPPGDSTATHPVFWSTVGPFAGIKAEDPHDDDASDGIHFVVKLLQISEGGEVHRLA